MVGEVVLESPAEPAGAHVLKEGADGLGILLRSGHQVQQHPLPGRGEAPGGHHRRAPLPRANALGDAVDEEDDLVLAEVARGEVLVVPPELPAQFGHGGS